MAEFINTVDKYDDEELLRLLVSGNLIEFCTDATTFNPALSEPGLRNSKIVKVDMPNYTGNIPSAWLYDCKSLVDVNIPHITQISNQCFYNCSSLEYVSFPYVNNFSISPFDNCTALKEAHFPSLINLTSLGKYLANLEVLECHPNAKITDASVNSFRGMQKIKHLPPIDTSIVFTLSDYSFLDCYILEELDTSSIIKIGTSALSYCKKITTFDLRNVETVSSSAFRGDESLLSVDLPKATSVDFNSLFRNCTSLKTVRIPLGTNSATNTTQLMTFDNCISLETVELNNIDSLGQPDVIGNGIGFFNNCTSLTNVTIPKLKHTGQKAFYNCTSLKQINFPELLTVGAGAFYNTGLTSVSLPKCENINYGYGYGSGAFQDCKSLESVDLPLCKYWVPASSNYNGACTFKGCTNLISINLPLLEGIASGVNTYDIGGHFEGCTSLEKIRLPKLKGIYGNTFKGCTNLKYVDLGITEGIAKAFDFTGCETLNAVILRSNTLVPLSINWLSVFPSSNLRFSIYVPKNLLDSYKTATNWSAIADRFKAIEDNTSLINSWFE